MTLHASEHTWPSQSIDADFSLDFFEVLIPSSHIIVPTLKVVQFVNLVSLTGSIYVPYSHWSTDATSYSAQEGTEVTNLPVIHHHAFGSGVGRSILIQVHLFGSLSLVRSHDVSCIHWLSKL